MHDKLKSFTTIGFM